MSRLWLSIIKVSRSNGKDLCWSGIPLWGDAYACFAGLGTVEKVVLECPCGLFYKIKMLLSHNSLNLPKNVHMDTPIRGFSKVPLK